MWLPEDQKVSIEISEFQGSYSGLAKVFNQAVCKSLFFQTRSRLQQSVRSPKSSLDPQHQNSTLITGTLLSPCSPDFQGSALFQIFKMFLSKMLKAADHPMLMGKGGRMVSQLTKIVLFLSNKFFSQTTRSVKCKE